MNETIREKRESREQTLRRVCFAAAELFAAVSVVRFLITGESERILLSLATLGLLCVPRWAEKLLGCRLSLPLYLFGLFYALGAMLGHSYKLYYILPWWDKMLHLCGGLAFALVGYYLPQRLGLEGRNRRLICAVFALCFSMAVALLWEFFEYAMDTFFGMNMQSDTVIHELISYKLGEGMGNLGAITDIQEIYINGEPLGVGGYLDTGLIDTMNDTLMESLGALAMSVWLYRDRDRHALLRWPEGKEKL